MAGYAVLALAVAAVLIAFGVGLAVGIAVGRVIRQRDTQIPRKDEEQ